MTPADADDPGSRCRTSAPLGVDRRPLVPVAPGRPRRRSPTSRSSYTHPGCIAADTKAYLYLDPAHLSCARRATCGTRTSRWARSPTRTSATCSRWDRGTGSSTSSDVPTWIAQRLWMGTLLFAAGTGVRYLARLLGIAAWGQLAAALPYMLSPFIVDYLARTSAILMPWAGLGWMLGFTVLAVRRGGWRYPAAVRARRRAGRGRQRHVDPARRPRAGDLARARWAARRRRRGATSCSATLKAGVLSARRLAVVGRGPVGGGRLRHQRPALHRDVPDRHAHVARVRGRSAGSATGTSTGTTRSSPGRSRPRTTCRTRSGCSSASPCRRWPSAAPR